MGPSFGVMESRNSKIYFFIQKLTLVTSDGVILNVLFADANSIACGDRLTYYDVIRRAAPG